MLEILIIIFIAKKIGKIAERRGHKKGPNIAFFIVMWLAGEFLGAAIGIFLFKGNLIPAYFMALIGAALGTVFAFNIVQKLEDKSDNDDGVITINID
ncbi:MAG: hypothetical protein PF450_04975 [Bacteroidales bacterium]|jgi:hypothetical protein|nr:hypothetical protein [Bacteroidales bacterium]